MFKIGEKHKLKNGEYVVIVAINIDIEKFKYLFGDKNKYFYSGYETMVVFNLNSRKFMAHKDSGIYGSDNSIHKSLDIDFYKTITIDGKDIEISEESYEELKRSLLDD